MALRRPDITCSCCGHKVGFKHNPLTPYQKMVMFVGDTGGHYPDICDNCGKNVNEGLLKGLVYPPGHDEMIEELNRFIESKSK